MKIKNAIIKKIYPYRNFLKNRVSFCHLKLNYLILMVLRGYKV